MTNAVTQLRQVRGIADAGTAVADAARRLGAEEAVLLAILKVESQGKPYDGNGRLIILPEKHVFWRELPKRMRAGARAMGLAAPKWSRANYRGLGGSGSDSRWDRLESMADVHEGAALKSASYGAPQIMGFNHAICGYSSVTDFVFSLAKSEAEQVKAFIAYLENVGLADEIRERDFRAIARRYNGSGQVARYSALMAKAYQQLTGGKAPAITASDRVKMLRLGSEGNGVRGLQKVLIRLGYHVQADGDFGPATRRAVIAFQADSGLKPDGLAGPRTVEALKRAVPINQQPGGNRENLTVADLRKQGSQTIRQSDNLIKIGGGAIATGAASQVTAAASDGGGGMLDVIGGTIREVTSVLDPIMYLIPSGTGMLIMLFGGVGLYIAWRIRQRRLNDAREWRHVG